MVYCNGTFVPNIAANKPSALDLAALAAAGAMVFERATSCLAPLREKDAVTAGLTVVVPEDVTVGVTDDVTVAVPEDVTVGVTDDVTVAVPEDVTVVVLEDVTVVVPEDVSGSVTEGVNVLVGELATGTSPDAPDLLSRQPDTATTMSTAILMTILPLMCFFILTSLMLKSAKRRYRYHHGQQRRDGGPSPRIPPDSIHCSTRNLQDVLYHFTAVNTSRMMTKRAPTLILIHSGYRCCC
jgi:hypothetical protein